MQVNPQHGKYVAVCLLYRGEVGPNEAENAIKSARQSGLLDFVDWVPTGVRIGYNSHPAPNFEDTCQVGNQKLKSSVAMVCIICFCNEAECSNDSLLGSSDLQQYVNNTTLQSHAT